MPSDRYCPAPGRTLFFTATLNDTQSDHLVRHIGILRDAVRRTQQTRPFFIDAWCVMPEHLHAVWTLPKHDPDYVSRWREIKKLFSRTVVAVEGWPRQSVLWQEPLWERVLIGADDFRNHVDYVHYNPVKHGCVTTVKEWPYSTFHRAVRAGLYPEDWGGEGVVDRVAGEYEPRTEEGAE